MAFPQQVAVIIPAYKPSERTVALARELQGQGAGLLIFIDDGSGPEYAPFFAELSALGGVILRHCINLGKGRALKTAFNWLCNEHPECIGAITADADGQHTPADILACAEALVQNPDKLIMGCRSFEGENVPWKNKTGNKITSKVMGFVASVKVSDTQTGLRGIPREFMKALMPVAGERFEYETNMLLETRVAQVPILEVPIETVYIGSNESSHFNVFTDSVKIYASFFKFIASSLSSSVVDILLFTLISRFLHGIEVWYPYDILYATVGARVVSGLFNYYLNSRAVFRVKENKKSNLVKYFILSICQMALSALLVVGLAGFIPISSTVLKIIVDLVLFFMSYFIQNVFIFK